MPKKISIYDYDNMVRYLIDMITYIPEKRILFYDKEKNHFFETLRDKHASPMCEAHNISYYEYAKQTADYAYAYMRYPKKKKYLRHGVVFEDDKLNKKFNKLMFFIFSNKIPKGDERKPWAKKIIKKIHKIEKYSLRFEAEAA